MGYTQGADVVHFPIGVLCNTSHIPEPQAGEDLERVVDKLGASTELFERWQQAEEQMWNLPSSGFQLGPEERRATLLFMHVFVEPMGTSAQQVWFEAAALFDAFLQRAPCDTDIGSIPALGAALVKMALVKNKDTADLDMERSRIFWNTQLLAAQLRLLGHLVPDATEESISSSEVLLLSTLNWQDCVPSVQSWMGKFCARLDALTEGLPMRPTLEWMRERTSFYAMTVVIAAPQPPRLLALGLLAIGAVEAALLPLDSLRPDDYEPEAWGQLAEGLFAGRGPACPGPPRATSLVAGILEKAAGASSEEIQDACERVLLVFDGFASALPSEADTVSSE